MGVLQALAREFLARGMTCPSETVPITVSCSLVSWVLETIRLKVTARAWGTTIW